MKVEILISFYRIYYYLISFSPNRFQLEWMKDAFSTVVVFAFQKPQVFAFFTIVTIISPVVNAISPLRCNEEGEISGSIRYTFPKGK